MGAFGSPCLLLALRRVQTGRTLASVEKLRADGWLIVLLNVKQNTGLQQTATAPNTGTTLELVVAELAR